MATTKKKKAARAGRPPVINSCRYGCGFEGKATVLPKHETNCKKRVK